MICSGETNVAGPAICLYHAMGDAEWATVNRLACNLVHRGVVPPGPRDEEPEPSITVEYMDEPIPH